LQQTAKALERAFKDAFDKNQPNKRTPTFKWLGKNEAGIKYPQGVLLDSGNSVIKLPKLGWVKYRNSGKVLGKIKNVTISRKSGYFTLSIQTERELQTPIHQSKTAVGIDMGIVHFATLSTGEQIAPINSFKQLSETLAKAQRKLKHKVKFSANWQKQQAKVRKLHTTIANVRNNFLHQTSQTISKNHAMIVMEDLKVANMSRSSKGTLDAHGKQVAQKSGLNRSILDQGWGEFKRQIEYKQLWKGGMVLCVPAHHTSQTCHACGHVDPDNRKTQSKFRCVACGHEANADINAAQNILQRGMAWLSGKDQSKVNKKTNRGTHGDRLPSEWRKPSATETDLTQPLQVA
jgi:putative transposase